MPSDKEFEPIVSPAGFGPHPKGMKTRLIAAAVALAGCAEPLDEGWSGEPLIRVEGQVLAAGDAVEPRAAILWLSAAPYGIALKTDDVAIATEFPADFVVELPRLPSSDELGGTWSGVPYLPELPDVSTLFGVLIAYEDRDGSGSPEFDFSGYSLLDWVERRTGGEEPLLVGRDELVGLAPDFLIAAVRVPDGTAVIDELLDDEWAPSLAAVGSLRAGVHAYRADGDGWPPLEPPTGVELRLFGE